MGYVVQMKNVWTTYGLQYLQEKSLMRYALLLGSVGKPHFVATRRYR